MILLAPNVGNRAVKSAGQLREVPIPIQGSAWPLLKAAFPLTEDAWTQMIMVLNAMKQGLVEPARGDADPIPPDAAS